MGNISSSLRQGWHSDDPFDSFITWRKKIGFFCWVVSILFLSHHRSALDTVRIMVWPSRQVLDLFFLVFDVPALQESPPIITDWFSISPMTWIFWLLVPISIWQSLKDHKRRLVMCWIFCCLCNWMITDGSCSFPIGLVHCNCSSLYEAESLLYVKEIARLGNNFH